MIIWGHMLEHVGVNLCKQVPFDPPPLLPILHSNSALSLIVQKTGAF